MKDLNKIFLMGRLGSTPLRRETKNGLAVTHFSLATSRRVKSADSSGAFGESPSAWEDETQWHRVVVWGKQAENCAQYLKKGSSVFLEGRIQSHKYLSKETSSSGAPIERTAFEVHTDNVTFLNTPTSGLSGETTGQIREMAS